MAKTDFSFEDFDKALSKVPGMELGSIIETNTFSEITEYIHTGNYLLNAQISGSIFGGVPNARSIGLVGDPETGKTFICLNIAYNAIKQGYYIFWCDTEGALEKVDVEKFNIDTKKLRYQPTKTVEQFKIFMGNLLSMKEAWEKEHEKPFKFMVILDSMGMLSTAKEVGDLKDNKVVSDMGTKAKQLRSLYRAITLDMTGAKIPLVVTNHTTIGGIGSYTGPTKESAGGDGPIFAMSNVLFLSKKLLREDDNDAKKTTGMLMTSRQKKTRKILKIPITIHVSYLGGMNPFVGLEDYVSWEACGIERGKIMTKKEFDKQNKEGVEFTRQVEMVDKKTGKETHVDEQVWFVASPNGRFCVRHLGKSLQAAKYLFTPKVFTQEVLRNLDENAVKPTFQIPEKTNDFELNFGLMENGKKIEEIADGTQ